MNPFLIAQASEPFNPAPMLILADWLEEHGDLAGAEVLRALAGDGVPSVVALSLATANVAATGGSDGFGPIILDHGDMEMEGSFDPLDIGVGSGDVFEAHPGFRHAKRFFGDGRMDGFIEFILGGFIQQSGFVHEGGCGLGCGERFWNFGGGEGSGESHLRFEGGDDGAGDGLVEDGRIRTHPPIGDREGRIIDIPG